MRSTSTTARASRRISTGGSSASRPSPALVAVLASITAPSTVTAEQRVWRWFQKCDPVNAIAVEVRLDATLLYRASFPICHVDASDVSRQDPRILKFSFKPGRRVLWRGYPANRDTTDATH